MDFKAVLNIVSKEDLTKKAIEATNKFFVPDKEPKQTISKKGQNLLSIIKDSDFGCQKENVVKLMELLTDESLLPAFNEMKTKQKYNPTELVCFIITGEDSGFNIDDECIIINVNDTEMLVKGIDEDDVYGYDNDVFNNCRKMTDEEITKFVNSLYASI